MKSKSLLIILCISLFNLNVLFSRTTKERQIAEIDSLNNLSQQSTFDVSIDNTLKYAMQALAKSQSIKYCKGQVVACNLIGQAMYHSGNYKEALEYFAKAESVKSKKNLSLSLSQIFKTKGLIYEELGMTDRAIDVLNQAITLANKISNEDYQNFITSQIYEVLAELHYNHNNIDLANYYITQNLEILSETDDALTYPNKVNLYTFIGKQKLTDNDLVAAFDYLLDAKKLIKDHDYAYKSNTLKVLGDVYLASNDVQSALKCYRTAVSNIKETKLNSELPQIYSSMILAFELDNQADSAHYYKDAKIEIERNIMSANPSASFVDLDFLLSEEAILLSKSKNQIRIIWGAISIVAVILTLIISIKRKQITHFFNNIFGKKNNHSKENILLDLARTFSPDFIPAFQSVYPTFHQNLIAEHPNLTPSDLELCYMTYLGISTKDIATFTQIGFRSVQTKRSRLRKKMNIPTEIDFGDYLRMYDE